MVTNIVRFQPSQTIVVGEFEYLKVCGNLYYDLSSRFALLTFFVGCLQWIIVALHWLRVIREKEHIDTEYVIWTLYLVGGSALFGLYWSFFTGEFCFELQK